MGRTESPEIGCSQLPRVQGHEEISLPFRSVSKIVVMPINWGSIQLCNSWCHLLPYSRFCCCRNSKELVKLKWMLTKRLAELIKRVCQGKSNDCWIVLYTRPLLLHCTVIRKLFYTRQWKVASDQMAFGKNYFICFHPFSVPIAQKSSLSNFQSPTEWVSRMLCINKNSGQPPPACVLCTGRKICRHPRHLRRLFFCTSRSRNDVPVADHFRIWILFYLFIYFFCGGGVNSSFPAYKLSVYEIWFRIAY